MALISSSSGIPLRILAAYLLLLTVSAVSLRDRYDNLSDRNATIAPAKSVEVPPELAARYTWTATATHYTPAQGGHAICGEESGHCGAPSDGSAFWIGGTCTCGGSDPTCSRGYCYQCHGANECQSECPSCPTEICGKKFKITCVDPFGQGYCKYLGASVVMTVTNACPQYNPCNTCKNPNPCRGGYNHIDLCDATFTAIAIPSKQPGEGIMIGVDPA